MYNQAKAFSQLPSNLLQIRDAWTAYQFNNACLYLGRVIENALAENDNLPQNQRQPASTILARILDNNDVTTTNSLTQKYNTSLQQLARLGPVRRMKIPESGVW